MLIYNNYTQNEYYFFLIIIKYLSYFFESVFFLLIFFKILLDDDDDTEFQTSKIRSLQIKPINECNSKITASFDELKNAIDHLSLQRSLTIDKVNFKIN